MNDVLMVIIKHLVDVIAKRGLVVSIALNVI